MPFQVSPRNSKSTKKEKKKKSIVLFIKPGWELGDNSDHTQGKTGQKEGGESLESRCLDVSHVPGVAAERWFIQTTQSTPYARVRRGAVSTWANVGHYDLCGQENTKD